MQGGRGVLSLYQGVHIPYCGLIPALLTLVAPCSPAPGAFPSQPLLEAEPSPGGPRLPHPLPVEAQSSTGATRRGKPISSPRSLQEAVGLIAGAPCPF